jgi:hypothetical protein
MLKFVAAFPGEISFEGIMARFGPDTDRLTAALKELERHDVLREKDWRVAVHSRADASMGKRLHVNF